MKSYAKAHNNIRYVRQATNVGPTLNFESLRAEATGDYFMFLGDDDWLDPGYVGRCVQFHRTHPGYSLVAGMTRYRPRRRDRR